MVTPLVTPVNYSSIKPQYVPRNILLAVPVSPDAAILSVLSPSRCLDLTSHWNDIPLQMFVAFSLLTRSSFLLCLWMEFEVKFS